MNENKIKIKNYYIVVEGFTHDNVTFHRGAVLHATPAGDMVRVFGKHMLKIPAKYVRPLEPAEACSEAALRGAYDTISNLREFGFNIKWGAAEAIAKFIEAAFVHLDGDDAIEALMKKEIPEGKCAGGFLETGAWAGACYDGEHDVEFRVAPNGNIWAKTEFEKPEDIPDQVEDYFAE